ncbi:MAG: hypothetical protein ABSA11_05250 [Candidatus Bathyarchaeia archaeon]|jgi:hypothetical protein
MKGIEYETDQVGFNAVLRNWQLKVMQVVWNSPKGVNSRIAWTKVNQAMEGETISRASVINFLEAQRERGVLKGEEETGKGGHHWVYYPEMDEAGFRTYIVQKMINSLMENFPKETKDAIKEIG